MGKQDGRINAFFGAEAELDGKLTFKGAVRIDGRLKGKIDAEGTLIVGETAWVEADTQVTEILISGRVQGNITAERRIEIRAPGKVFGNIKAPIVSIEEGAVFDGNCRMQSDADTDEKKVAVLPGKTGSKNGSQV